MYNFFAAANISICLQPRVHENIKSGSIITECFRSIYSLLAKYTKVDNFHFQTISVLRKTCRYIEALCYNQPSSYNAILYRIAQITQITKAITL